MFCEQLFCREEANSASMLETVFVVVVVVVVVVFYLLSIAFVL